MLLNTKLEKAYIWSISLALFLHIYNTTEIGGIKLFYIPSVISCIFSIALIKKNAARAHFTWLLLLYIIVTFISAFLSNYSNAIGSATNLFIILTATYGINYCNPIQISKINLLFIPLVLLGLFWCFLYSPLYDKYRFMGFYNDPNYLCTTLFIYVYIIFNIINREKKSSWLNISLLLPLLFLIFVTLSRTGIFCTLIIVLVGTFKLLKNSKLSLIFILVPIMCFTSLVDFGRYTDMLTERIFTDKNNAGAATSLREDLSTQYIDAVTDDLGFAIWGIGIGGTGNPSESQILVKRPGIRDHNTFTSCFSEQGIIGFVIFLLICGIKTKNTLLSTKISLYQKVSLMMLLLFALSIWQMTYLPFWYAFFLLTNPGKKHYDYENMAHTQSRKERNKWAF